MKAQTHKEMMMGGEWQRVTSRYISKLDFRLMFIGLFGSCFYISMIMQNDVLRIQKAKTIICCYLLVSNILQFITKTEY